MPELTVRRIETIKPFPDRERIVWDRDGLGLKVTPSGSKTFIYRYTYVRRRRTMTLGPYPVLGLAEAREKRRLQHAILLAGKDPLLQRDIAIQVKMSALTIEQAIDLFEKKWLKFHYKRPAAAAAMLRFNLVPVIGDVLVPDVEAPMITDAVNRVVARGSMVTANRLIPLARKLFDFLAAQHMRHVGQDNPVTIKKSQAGGTERPKTRNLLMGEIKDFLLLMDSPTIEASFQTRAALKLCMAMAKRPGEVVEMLWADVDMQARTWRNEATKMEWEPHIVFLNDYALAILRELHKLSGHTAYVFLSPQSPKKYPTPLRRRTMSQKVRDLHLKGQIKHKFTPHDMRRTFSSRMADLGIAPHIVEKILDHKMEGTMAVYNRASYFPERQAAMDLWGAKLEELVKPAG